MPGHNQERPTSKSLEPQDHSTNLSHFKELQPHKFSQDLLKQTFKVR